MSSAVLADEEWEVEIWPSSRYYTEGELVGGESRSRSTRPRADHLGLRTDLTLQSAPSRTGVNFAFRSSTPFSEFRSENLRDGPGRALY